MLLLAGALALGMGLSAVQAGEMAVKMIVAAGMDVPGHDGCHGCGGADDGASRAGCQTICMAPAVMPSPPSVETADAAASPSPRDFASDGRTAPPDPHPPRPVGIA